MTTSLRLRLEAGPDDDEDLVFRLGGRDVTIGRHEGCDVVLDAETVSGRHALLRPGPSGYRYLDLASKNGSALLRSGAGEPVPVAGEDVPIAAGDVLLLGGVDAPVRIHVEDSGAAFAKRRPLPEQTIVARRPLADLLAGGAPGALSALAAEAIGARDAEALAAAADAYLKAALPAARHGVLVRGSGFEARAGRDVPDALATMAAERAEVVLLDAGGELPETRSVLAAEARGAMLAPARAGDAAHGFLAAWSPLGLDALPTTALDELGVAASLVGLAAAALGTRLEGDRERERLDAENRRLRGSRTGGYAAADPVGASEPFVAAVDLARAIAPSDVPVLLSGETGTGKEVLAAAVHRWSPRRSKTFVTCNCAALPDSLLESELFGHTRGAFTGASGDRGGLFEEADGGTIFLDEIGEMPPAMQAKLLRVLENGEVRRVGSNRPTRVDVRVVSATHRDLEAMVAAGTFRQDLMYRLNAVTVEIPPLRDRGDDVLLLAHHLLGRACTRLKKRVPGFTGPALRALRAHPWPGNVRELDNEVLRAVALTPAGEAISAPAFSRRLAALAPDDDAEDTASPGLKEQVDEFERRLISGAVAEAGGNLAEAARGLGLTRPGLYKVMARLGMRD